MQKLDVRYLLYIYIALVFLLCFQKEAHSTTIVGITVSEGIVLAGDSRTTVKLQKVNRVATDYTQKVFQLNKKTAAATSGTARLLNKNIHSLIEEFKASNLIGDNDSIDKVIERLKEYFKKIYKKYKVEDPTKQIPNLYFLVAGYDKNGKGKLMYLQLPEGLIEERYSTDDNFGASWSGDIGIINRLIKGCSLELKKKLDEYNDNPETKEEQRIDPCLSEYTLGFQYMTIRDAIDLADFLIRITIETQRFTYGTKEGRVIMPDVGGLIDIAIVTPSGFKWIQKK